MHDAVKVGAPEVSLAPTARFFSKLSPEIRLLAGLLLIAGLLLGFGLVAEEMLEGDSTAFDRNILLFLRNPSDLSDLLGPPWLEETARDVSGLGSYAVLTVIVAAVSAYLFAVHRRGAAIWVLASVLGGSLLTNLLKGAFDRPRPDVVPHAVRVFTSSFPSGHAALSAVTYLSLGALLASEHSSYGMKTYFISLALLLTIAVGLSRVYLGIHYPTDVLAGWCVGSAWAIFCWLVWSWLKNRGATESYL